MPAAAQDKTTPENAPYPSFKIAEGLYYVGAADYAAYLLTTRAGLIVIDGGDGPTGRQVVANIRTLGFDPKTVKVLVNTHQHFDHAAGLAEVKRAAPGAKLYASAADAPIIEAGGKGDPYLKGPQWEYAPTKVDAIIKDGQKITLGGVTLTAHVTPGHTKGCTTWTFPVTVAGKVRQALVHCSSSVLPGYRLVAPETYPGMAADYERSHRFWLNAPCEVFLASHTRFFDLKAKHEALKGGKVDAFVDPAGCKAYYQASYKAFRTELEKQQKATTAK
ncbi:subclass B3 metallo-beta-lactamase [Phenylobacterium sp.]|uniref:subclass B3 metallo-beta-lactamase n=1 Tax=Phenylobacterium sp. TaxID=1871053 RepID=UPI0035B4B084